MRRLAAVLAALLVLFGGAAAAQEQGNRPQKLRVNDIDVSSAPQVAVTVTAPQELGTSPLPQSAFSVVEGGEQVSAKVEHIPSDGLDIVLVMDTSGSMQGEPMAAAQRSASDFIRQFPGSVRFSVVAFASDARVVTPFSPNADAHVAAIQGLEASGETALYDGLSTATGLLKDSNGRRAIVLLSDGGDTVSSTTLAKARRRVAGSGATVYGIRYSTAETNSAALDGLAARGRVIAAQSSNALGRVYDTIAQELVSQYRLSWTTTSGGPTLANITLASGGMNAVAKITLDLPGAAQAPAGPAPAEEAAPAPAPVPQEAPQPRFIAARIALMVGASMFFVGTALLLLLISAPRRRQIRLTAGRPQAEGLHRSLSELAEHAVQAAERGLERRNLTASLNESLERAGINLRPAEFLVLAGSAALTAGAFGMTASGPMMGLLLAIVVALVAKTYLGFRGSRRAAKFADQLNDTLQLLSGSLRAGYGMLQAIDSVAEEAPEPTAHEFRRLVVESRLGRDLTTSLQAMSERIRNEDFDWVVQAILIHREVGGDLAEVLDTVAHTVRERNQIRRQVKALAAEGKLSGIILTVIPPAVGLLISFINPGYLTPLFTTLPGLIMSVGGAILMVMGGLWMRKTVRLVF